MHEAQGVKFHMKSVVGSFTAGADGNVTGAVLKDGPTLKADLVVGELDGGVTLLIAPQLDGSLDSDVGAYRYRAFRPSLSGPTNPHNLSRLAPRPSPPSHLSRLRHHPRDRVPRGGGGAEACHSSGARAGRRGGGRDPPRGARHLCSG